MQKNPKNEKPQNKCNGLKPTKYVFLNVEFIMILKIKDSFGYLWQMLEKQLIILKTGLERGRGRTKNLSCFSCMNSISGYQIDEGNVFFIGPF